MLGYYTTTRPKLVKSGKILQVVSPKSTDTVQRLRQALEHAPKWEKLKTGIPGIWVVRMPGDELQLGIMFNPLSDQGTARKKKGWYFFDGETVEEVRVAFGNKGLDKLVSAVEKINGQSSRPAPGTEEVFEV